MIIKPLACRRPALVCALALSVAGAAWAAADAPTSTVSPHTKGHADARQARPAQSKTAASVEVQGAWIRATVPGQSGTGGFMALRSTQGPLALVGFSTPVAGTAELHEMAMQGEVMRMRPVSGLDLPAGQVVELKPGGHHLMLMDLKKPLVAGTSVPLVLKLKTPEGRTVDQRVNVPVRTAAPQALATPAEAHDHDHAH